MAALAVRAVTAAQLRERADAEAPPPAGPDDRPHADPGLIPLTVRESSAAKPTVTYGEFGLPPAG
jgi:hypothetical protein